MLHRGGGPLLRKPVHTTLELTHAGLLMLPVLEPLTKSGLSQEMVEYRHRATLHMVWLEATDDMPWVVPYCRTTRFGALRYFCPEV